MEVHRRICIVTGTRADYGLLRGLMHAVQEDPDLQLQVAVTGMHLSPEFGMTYREIEEDGLQIDERVEMLLSSDTDVGTAKSIGLGVIGFADALERLQPEIVVVLGDRFEVFAAAQAAMAERIPIAHIHGGETTRGAFDEAIRHSITKMAHLHFVAAEPYRRRVIQLGEHPDRVKTVGAPALDQVDHPDLLDRKALADALDLELSDHNFLITYHPTTLAPAQDREAVSEIVGALTEFPEATLIFTSPNADPEGRDVDRRIEQFVRRNPDAAALYNSLGHRLYLSALHHVDVVIGNSSSGIIEAPAVGVPTVNVGPRQAGRLKAPSVIDCAAKASEIAAAIRRALSESFQEEIRQMDVPYEGEGVAQAIKSELKRVSLDELTLAKDFHDLE